MRNKRSFGVRVYEIAINNCIEQVAVNRILNNYISVCRNDLLRGIEVRFFGLVSLVPDNITSEFVSTLADYAKRVAKNTGYPYHTVLTVIRSFMDTNRKDLLNGIDIDIRSIVSLHPLYRGDDLVKIHSSIAVSIKEDLDKLNGDVTSVRAHTCKLLKYTVAKQLNNGQEEI